MPKAGDSVDITETVQGQAVIAKKKGRIASVSGDEVEVDYPTVTGQPAKLPVKKSQLSPGTKPGDWSLTVQKKLG